MMLRDVWLRLWNWWHGYPRGSIEELPGGGTIITLQTGRKRGNWFYDEYMKRKKEDTE